MRRLLPSQTGQPVGNPITGQPVGNPITNAAKRLGAPFGGVNTTNPVNFLAEGDPLQVPDGRSQNPLLQRKYVSPYGDGEQLITPLAPIPTNYKRDQELGFMRSPVVKGLTEAGHMGGYQVGDKRSPLYGITESMRQQPQGTNTGLQVAGGTGRNQPPPASTELQPQFN